MRAMTNRTIFRKIAAVALMIAASSITARAQAFADLKSALVDYSKADVQPRKDCEALSGFRKLRLK
jgi:hypothetical protein